MSFIGGACPYCGAVYCRCVPYNPPTHIYPMPTYYPAPPVVPTDIRQGWECPRCKKILAPHVDSCNCVQVKNITSTSSVDFLKDGVLSAEASKINNKPYKFP